MDQTGIGGCVSVAYIISLVECEKNVGFGPKMKGLAASEIDEISHHFLEQLIYWDLVISVH